ncbi:MAG: hypothetical protein AB9866_28395 [Syntrophobacteraceae bacterium]
MAKQFTVISGNRLSGERTVLLPEEKFRHYQNIVSEVLGDAQNTWGELWQEFQGKVVDGVLILPDAQRGFKPKCGWPEFLEMMWLLKHYIDYARRFSEEKI